MSAKTKTRKIQCTWDYNLFSRSSDNRVINEEKHKSLFESMKLYGFLACYPIICFRDKKGHLFIKDGQHRLIFAERLGLPVYWTEEEVDFDVAMVNSTAKPWVLKDYAEKYAANGSPHYIEGLTFSEDHKLPVGVAFCLLAGVMQLRPIHDAFINGKFEVKDRKWAREVADVYGGLLVLQPQIKNARLLESCMYVCRAPSFDKRRLLQCAQRCRQKLVPYSTRDAYLEMIEDVYNYGCKNLVGLKAEALMAMRARTEKSNGKVG